MAEKRKNTHSTTNDSIDEFIKYFKTVIQFKAHSHDASKNQIRYSPLRKKANSSQINSTEKKLETFANKLITQIDNHEIPTLSFEDDEQRNKFKLILAHGFNEYQKSPKALFEAYDDEDRKVLERLEKSNYGNYINNFHAILLMARVAEFSDVYRTLNEGKELTQDYEDSGYLFPSVFFKLLMDHLPEHGKTLKLSQANNFYQTTFMFEHIKETKGLDFSIYTALEETSITTKSYRRILTMIEDIYLDNEKDRTLNQEDYTFIQKLNHFLMKKKDLHYSHFKTSYQKACRFSINYNPADNQTNVKEIDFNQLTEHLFSQMPLKACNPYYVQAWLKQYNDSLKKRASALSFKKLYWHNIKSHVYMACIIALASSAISFCLVFQLYTSMIMLELSLTLGLISFVYSQLIVNVNLEAPHLYHTFKISDSNIRWLFNLFTMLTLGCAWLICYASSLNLQITILVLSNVLGFSGLFSVFLNCFAQCQLFKNNKPIETCFKEELKQLNETYAKGKNNVSLYSLFQYDQETNAITLRSPAVNGLDEDIDQPKLFSQYQSVF